MTGVLEAANARVELPSVHMAGADEDVNGASAQLEVVVRELQSALAAARSRA
jgi:hypothetical protein